MEISPMPGAEGGVDNGVAVSVNDTAGLPGEGAASTFCPSSTSPAAPEIELEKGPVEEKTPVSCVSTEEALLA
ncbi:unnamed protein product, partial [Laminaria digitata]